MKSNFRVFSQFYNMSTGYVIGTIPPVFAEEAKKPIPACGSDSILFLDGRQTLANMKQAAAVECKRRGFIGFSIHNGSLLKSIQLANFATI